MLVKTRNWIMEEFQSTSKKNWGNNSIVSSRSTDTIISSQENSCRIGTSCPRSGPGWRRDGSFGYLHQLFITFQFVETQKFWVLPMFCPSQESLEQNQPSPKHSIATELVAFRHIDKLFAACPCTTFPMWSTSIWILGLMAMTLSCHWREGTWYGRWVLTLFGENCFEVACDSGQPYFPFFLNPHFGVKSIFLGCYTPVLQMKCNPMVFPSHVKIEKAFSVFLFRQNRMPLSLI